MRYRKKTDQPRSTISVHVAVDLRLLFVGKNHPVDSAWTVNAGAVIAYRPHIVTSYPSNDA